MRLARFAAAWSGGLIAFFGVLYLVATERMLAFAELSGLTPTALTDARVMYGALQIAPGLLILASLWRQQWLEPALALATLLFAWIPLVRIFGMAHDGAANSYHLTALVIELGTCALTAIAWRSLRRRDPQPPPAGR